MPNEDLSQDSLVRLMIEHERGTLDDAGEVRLFQYLVDSGLAWQMQGHYGRVAKAMLDQGIIHAPTRREA